MLPARSIVGALGVVLVTASLAHAGPMESLPFGAHSIVVPATKTAYVMTDDKGAGVLVAVDLATGKQRWRQPAAAKPVGQSGDRLVALTDAGGLVVLDAKTGAKATPCATIATVSAPFGDGLGVNQRAVGYDTGTGLYLSWTRDTHYAGGAAPPPEIERQSRTHTERTWAIDLARCTATVVKSAAVPETGQVTDTLTKITTSAGTAELRLSSTTGGLLLTPARGGKTIDLTEGDPTRQMVTVSVDRRHVACGDPMMRGALAVFDLATGKVYRPKMFAFAYPWLYVGKQLIGGAGGVGSIDPTTGKVLWSVAERTTSYDGPVPP